MGGAVARGLAAGVAGGLLAAAVGLLVAWPALDRAVALEEAAAAAHALAGVEHDAGVTVSRAAQRVGGVLGLVLVGAVVGAALAAACRAVGRPGSLFPHALALGSAVLVALVAVPQLRYPPLPPGVEVSGGSYLGAVAVGVVVVAAHAAARSALRARDALAPTAEAGLAAAAVLAATLAAAVLPDRSGRVLVPADLLWDFRVGAIAVQVVLVVATAALVGVFLDLAERRSRLTAAPDPLPV